MRLLLLLITLSHFACTHSQEVVNVEYPTGGNIDLSESVAIPKVKAGYTLWLPESGNAKGLLVFTHARRDTINQDELIKTALGKNLAVIYATTDNPLEFFFEDSKMQEMEDYLFEVIQKYNLPANKMLYCGMSLEGTRALKLAAFGKSGKSKHGLVPKAIAICDAPLDMIRFHREAKRAIALNFNEIAVNEASWVSAYLEKNLGTPTDNESNYIEYSPLCYQANGGPNLKYFESIAIRAYTEPDVQWWIENRRKSYYGMNTIDLAELVNELRIRGNQAVELINTQNKGFKADGTRHPHSWSIVNEKEMIDWFIQLTQS